MSGVGWLVRLLRILHERSAVHGDHGRGRLGHACLTQHLCTNVNVHLEC